MPPPPPPDFAQGKDYQPEAVEGSAGTATPVDPRLFEDPEGAAGGGGEPEEGDGQGAEGDALEQALASEQYVSDEGLAKTLLCEEYFSSTAPVTDDWMDECEVRGRTRGHQSPGRLPQLPLHLLRQVLVVGRHYLQYKIISKTEEILRGAELGSRHFSASPYQTTERTEPSVEKIPV